MIVVDGTWAGLPLQVDRFSKSHQDYLRAEDHLNDNEFYDHVAEYHYFVNACNALLSDNANNFSSLLKSFNNISIDDEKPFLGPYSITPYNPYKNEQPEIALHFKSLRQLAVQLNAKQCLESINNRPELSPQQDKRINRP